MTDQRRAYTLKCLCGFTREKHIGRPPKVCPQCGAKPEPDGLNRAMRRKLAREMRKSKGLVTTSPDLEPAVLRGQATDAALIHEQAFPTPVYLVNGKPWDESGDAA